jgi:hypothetical protein
MHYKDLCGEMSLFLTKPKHKLAQAYHRMHSLLLELPVNQFQKRTPASLTHWLDARLPVRALASLRFLVKYDTYQTTQHSRDLDASFQRRQMLLAGTGQVHRICFPPFKPKKNVIL